MYELLSNMVPSGTLGVAMRFSFFHHSPPLQGSKSFVRLMQIAGRQGISRSLSEITPTLLFWSALHIEGDNIPSIFENAGISPRNLLVHFEPLISQPSQYGSIFSNDRYTAYLQYFVTDVRTIARQFGLKELTVNIGLIVLLNTHQCIDALQSAKVDIDQLQQYAWNTVRHQ